MRYLVLGAGGVGPVVADYLARLKSSCEVVIADLDSGKAIEACATINRLEPHVFCRSISCDSGNISPSFLSKYNAIISALPARFNYALADKVVNAGTNYCDLGGVNSVTEKMIANLNDKAEKNGVTVSPDNGIMPGKGTMDAWVIVQDFDPGASICIYVGGMPQKPRPPLYYDAPFYIGGLESICYDTASVLENGEIVNKKPLSDVTNLWVKELAEYSPSGDGHIEAFVTAGASLAHETFLKRGHKNFCENTIRWPGFVDFINSVSRHEFAEKIGKLVRPINSDNPDLLWMRIVIEGKINGRDTVRTYNLLDLYDQATGFSAMGRCTGISAGIVAKYLARGEAKFGVRTPENAFEVWQLRQMLEESKKYFNIRIETKAA